MEVGLGDLYLGLISGSREEGGLGKGGWGGGGGED